MLCWFLVLYVYVENYISNYISSVLSGTFKMFLANPIRIIYSMVSKYMLPAGLYWFNALCFSE